MGCAASQPVSLEQSARVKTNDKSLSVGDIGASKQAHAETAQQAQQRKLAADDQRKHEKGSANEPPARDVDARTPSRDDDARPPSRDDARPPPRVDARTPSRDNARPPRDVDARPPARDVDARSDSFYTPDNSDDERSRRYDTSRSHSLYATSIESPVSTRSNDDAN